MKIEEREDASRLMVSCLYSPLKSLLQFDNRFQLQRMTHNLKPKMHSSTKSHRSQQGAEDESMTALLRPQTNSRAASTINLSMVRPPMVLFTKLSKLPQVPQSQSKKSKLTSVMKIFQVHGLCIDPRTLPDDYSKSHNGLDKLSNNEESQRCFVKDDWIHGQILGCNQGDNDTET